MCCKCVPPADVILMCPSGQCDLRVDTWTEFTAAGLQLLDCFVVVNICSLVVIWTSEKLLETVFIIIEK